MARTSRLIEVPAPEQGSFDMKRPVAKNPLLANQVRHFHQLEMVLRPEQRTGISQAEITTEGEAGEYIRRMHRILMSSAAKPGRK